MRIEEKQRATKLGTLSGTATAVALMVFGIVVLALEPRRPL